MRYLLLSLLIASSAFGQFTTTARHIRYGASVPATCNPLTGDVFFKTSATVTQYFCSATNTWTALTAGGGGTISGLTTNTVPKATSATTVGDSLVTDNGTVVSVGGQFSIKANPFIIELPNSSTGTTNNKLAKVVNTAGVLQAQIITTSTADQGAALGCVISGGGTTGTALIMIAGTGSCYFDSATTAGHIAIPSSTSAGALHDTGSSSSPSTGLTIATAGATNACGSPPCLIAGNLFMTPDIVATGGNGNGGGNGGGNGAKQQTFSYVCNIGSATSTTAITTGDTGCYSDAPSGATTINRVDIIGNAASLATCSITVDIWYTTSTSALPTASNKASASAPATLSTANASKAGSLSGWTTAVAAGGTFGASVASVTGCVYAQVKVFMQ